MGNISTYESYVFNNYFGIELPEHWDEKRLGYLASNDKNAFVDGPFGSDLKTNDYKEDGIPLIQLNNIRDGKHILRNFKYVTEQKKNELSRHIARPRDIVLAKMAEPVARSAIVSEQFDEYVIVADCVKMTPDSQKIDLNFLNWAINSEVVKTQAELVSTGTTRIRISLGELKKLKVPYPSHGEQTQIANFLDHETAKIDTLIEKQQQLIKLLKEKRQAVISHAVTKGLNPQAPMKDSGVEWLGEVPEHWEVKAIKFTFTSLDYRRIPLSGEVRGMRSGEYRYYGASGVIDYIDAYIFDESTVLVGEDGANLLNRNTPLAFSAHGKYWVNNHAHILKPIDDLADYWAEVIEIIDIAPIVSGSAQPKLTAEALNNLTIAFPPTLEERQQIDVFIKNTKAAFEALSAKASSQVLLLKERRTALISAAVTGKIDVRNWQAPTHQDQALEQTA
ncbi:restriction endonuclease subunit S [Vibrio fluvialis]|nr:restriction endonuclease subunit S [Vibrio fluvialis]EKO3459468.1 restriction endonuclease subunit S [Vibrio fluvialis]